MANVSDLTRKEQVLARLKSEMGSMFTHGWVDGPDLANEEVGGSEGLKRLRELRSEGHLIQARKHPDAGRDIYQYRLVRQSTVDEVSAPTRREPPNGGSPSYSPPPGGDRPAQHVEARGPEVSRTDWECINATTREYRRTFWVRNPKQRLVGAIAVDFDRQRWFWSVRLPEYKGARGTKKDPGLGAHPEKRLGSGIISMAGGAGMIEAMAAVEQRVRELKEDPTW